MRMQSVATDGVAWFVSVTVGHDHQLRKMAELIEMQFGIWTHEPKEPCIRWEPDPLHPKGHL